MSRAKACIRSASRRATSSLSLPRWDAALSWRALISRYPNSSSSFTIALSVWWLEHKSAANRCAHSLAVRRSNSPGEYLSMSAPVLCGSAATNPRQLGSFFPPAHCQTSGGSLPGWSWHGRDCQFGQEPSQGQLGCPPSLRLLPRAREAVDSRSRRRLVPRAGRFLRRSPVSQRLLPEELKYPDGVVARKGHQGLYELTFPSMTETRYSSTVS